MRTRDDAAASKISEPPSNTPDAALVERVDELELQLAAARRMLHATLEGLDGASRASRSPAFRGADRKRRS